MYEYQKYRTAIICCRFVTIRKDALYVGSAWNLTGRWKQNRLSQWRGYIAIERRCFGLHRTFQIHTLHRHKGCDPPMSNFSKSSRHSVSTYKTPAFTYSRLPRLVYSTRNGQPHRLMISEHFLQCTLAINQWLDTLLYFVIYTFETQWRDSDGVSTPPSLLYVKRGREREVIKGCQSNLLSLGV